MALYKFKEKGRKVVRPLLRFFMVFHPDLITWFSFLFSAGAGYALWKTSGRMLLLVPVMLLGRLMCNLMDGMVAREKGISSKRGEALQEAVDRFSDSAILLGLSFSPQGNILLGIFTITLVLISSYLGILKKAVGGEREFGGIMGKVDRVWVVIVCSILQAFYKKLGPFTFVELALLIILVGSVITIVGRALSIRRDIER